MKQTTINDALKDQLSRFKSYYKSNHGRQYHKIPRLKTPMKKKVTKVKVQVLSDKKLKELYDNTKQNM